jgi:hypothetical protein
MSGLNCRVPDDRPVPAVLNSGSQAAILNLGNASRSVSRSARCNPCGLTIFLSAFDGHLPAHALAITARACLVPPAVTFLLLFKLPMHARQLQSWRAAKAVSALSGCGFVDVGAELFQAESHAAFDRAGRYAKLSGDLRMGELAVERERDDLFLEDR